MRAYLLTTGGIFALLAVLHIWRMIAEWPQGGPGGPFLLGMAALILIPAVLAGWAWRLWRALPGGGPGR